MSASSLKSLSVPRGHGKNVALIRVQLGMGRTPEQIAASLGLNISDVKNKISYIRREEKKKVK